MTSIDNRISRHIREYDGQGWHRTGTTVDLESAHWLAGLVEEVGVEPVLESFTLDRVVPGESYIEVSGRRIEGLPLFDGGFTGAEGVHGQMGRHDAKIMLVEGSPILAAEALDDARRSGNYRALVFVTNSIGSAPGLAPRNAPDFTEPFGPPVLQVNGVEHDSLVEQADAGASVRVVVQAERRPGEAVNVAAEIQGQDRDLPPLVVMTPRSGWWEIAAERGGGIACWLEVMRVMQIQRPTRDVRFVATSGHELGHLGLKAYLNNNPNLATDALVWMHLGASIGASVDATPNLYTSDEGLERRAVHYLKSEVSKMPVVRPRDGVPGGESREIHQRGGSYVSLAGGHATFHQQADRWPDTVDIESVASYAKSMTDLAREFSC